MDYRILPAGTSVPDEIYAIVEIPKGQGRIKYEYRTNGMIVIDRLRNENLPLYPVHYCGIPSTLAPDGDPLDILVLGNDDLKTGDVIPVRPVCVFLMQDEKGIDPKIISVPADSISVDYVSIRCLADISGQIRTDIKEFFRTYKQNDMSGKWSESKGWDDLNTAHRIINKSITRWNVAQKQD